MGYRVLVVDDSPVLRIMLREMLESLGHEVVEEAEDGEGALKAYREKRPELVTLDISLPDMNGIQVLQKLRLIDASANVLVVTGNDQKAIADKALTLKALSVLRKPFDETELKIVLEKIGPRIAKRK